jgi:hypothetical protein
MAELLDHDPGAPGFSDQAALGAGSGWRDRKFMRLCSVKLTEPLLSRFVNEFLTLSAQALAVRKIGLLLVAWCSWFRRNTIHISGEWKIGIARST